MAAGGDYVQQRDRAADAADGAAARVAGGRRRQRRHARGARRHRPVGHGRCPRRGSRRRPRRRLRRLRLQPREIDEEAALAHTKYDVKKAFGAIARIDNSGQAQLNDHQRGRLDAFMQRYIAQHAQVARTTPRQHRPHMADPRVVNGFRPLTKEITYQIVIERSKGSHLWDLDGNEYVDALNGFGMSLFGWQPDFVIDAVQQAARPGLRDRPAASAGRRRRQADLRSHRARSRRRSATPAPRRCWARCASRARSPGARPSCCSPAPTTASSTR